MCNTTLVETAASGMLQLYGEGPALAVIRAGPTPSLKYSSWIGPGSPTATQEIRLVASDCANTLRPVGRMILMPRISKGLDSRVMPVLETSLMRAVAEGTRVVSIAHVCWFSPSCEATTCSIGVAS